MKVSSSKSSNRRPRRSLVLVLILLLGCILLWFFVERQTTSDYYGYSLLMMNAAAAAAADNHQHETTMNPMLSIKPLTKSLHPTYKLWSEMTPNEQQAAIQYVGENYVRKYGKLITKRGATAQQKHKQGDCEIVQFSGHNLCQKENTTTTTDCSFISFGINDDPSWDIELATKWNCRGFAGDPTVEHPSKLHPRVTFHNLGATLLFDNEEREINKGGTEDWWLVSMPKLRYFLGLEHIDVVKLDCEGCEVAFARDILREDPSYLSHVDQLSIETHVTRTWLNSTEHFYYFGLQFALLEEAGFKLEYSNVFGCSKRHEVTGCVPELEQYGFPCGYKPWPGKTQVVLGYSCQDFLWKRYPK